MARCGSILADACRGAVRATGHRLAEEYIAEAEHGDGFGYWDNFADVEEALEDFRVYCEEVDRT